MTSPFFTEAGISGHGGWARSSSLCVMCVCGAASACSSTAAGKRRPGPGKVLWEQQVTKKEWEYLEQCREGQHKTDNTMGVRFEGCLAVSDKVLKGFDELKPRALLRSKRCQTVWGSGVSTFSQLQMESI